MGTTQFDIITDQVQAAAHNAAAGAASRLRRDTSLGNQGHRFSGRAVLGGGEALRRGVRWAGGQGAPNDGFVETPSQPQQPAADGYVRRSPVQPVYRAKNYYRRLLLRAAGLVALAAVACVAVYLLLQLGIFGR